MQHQQKMKFLEVTEAIHQQRFFEKFSIYPIAEYAIMKEIHRKQSIHENITISEIANQIKISVPAISRTIKTLSEKGWIEKLQLDCDKRAYHIQLTHIGLQHYQQQSQIFCDKFSQVLSLMDEQALSSLVFALSQMKNAMDEVIRDHEL